MANQDCSEEQQNDKQWRIQDFTDGVANLWVWGYYLARLLLKTTWKWKKLNGGGTFLASPLDPPMTI